MAKKLTYTTESLTADISAKEYIKDYRRADYFMGFCEECQNYGRRYGCPPFDYEPLSVISGYENVRILGVKITPDEKQLPMSDANEFIGPVTNEMNKRLLEMEEALDGLAFGFVGACPYCGGEPCARLEGKPCKHVDKVRPSLEAFGFDMSKTASNLLGMEIKWSNDGLIPDYFLLVCGIFY